MTATTHLAEASPFDVDTYGTIYAPRGGAQPGQTLDTGGQGFAFLHDAHAASVPDGAYTGRVSVPVLWDKQTAQVVGDEWSDFLPDSKDLISDWRAPMSCGNFNVAAGKCGGKGK